jgi:hypothetical protein
LVSPPMNLATSIAVWFALSTPPTAPEAVAPLKGRSHQRGPTDR